MYFPTEDNVYKKYFFPLCVASSMNSLALDIDWF